MLKILIFKVLIFKILINKNNDLNKKLICDDINNNLSQTQEWFELKKKICIDK